MISVNSGQDTKKAFPPSDRNRKSKTPYCVKTLMEDGSYI